ESLRSPRATSQQRHRSARDPETRNRWWRGPLNQCTPI
ncbi:hypothetical protein A2U01_0103689, partial [Trifolium medium]|nr:hypothetical protein [Trifolium medium]